MTTLQVWAEIEPDDPATDAATASARLAALQAQLRDALATQDQVEVVDMAVRTEANVDPQALRELAVLLSSAAATVSAGTLLLAALRKFVKEAGALVRTVRVEIGGKPVPLAQVTAAQIDEEIARPRKRAARKPRPRDDATA